ncbi:MAG: hypothetical protein AAFY41_14360 [Bacteroidota bacterium]
MKHFFLLIGLVLFSCGAPSGKKKQESTDESSSSTQTNSENKVVFNKINNKVKVYVDDSLIYESETYLAKYEVQNSVDISPYIINGSEVLKIELYNGTEPYEELDDPKWEIMFDVILDGEVVDFVSESIRENKVGKVYEMTYKVEDWLFDSLQ